MKNRKVENRGFTLIELLLVIAIIGILAGAILVGISGQRQKARRASAMETVRSVMPYLIECYMKSGTVKDPTDATAGGNSICDSSAVKWPSLSGTECTWEIPDDGIVSPLEIDCPGDNISCNYEGDGNCQ